MKLHKLLKWIAGIGVLTGFGCILGCGDDSETTPDHVVNGAENCCKGLEGNEYETCMADYAANNMCGIQNDVVIALYGMPSPDPFIPDKALEACCGDFEGESYESCVADYKEAGACQVSATVYGVPEPEPPVIEPPSEEAIEACCGDFEGESYESCVADYKEAGACQVSPPLYGPDPTDEENL